MLLSVSISIFGLYEGQYSVRNFGVSPSGNKVIFEVEEGGSKTTRRVRVVLREYKSDGSYVDTHVCGGSEETEVRDSRSGRVREVCIERVASAKHFNWLDEERVIFFLGWVTATGGRTALVMYDGEQLHYLMDGLVHQELSVYGNRFVGVSNKLPYPYYGPWVVGEIKPDASLELRELSDIDPPGEKLAMPVLAGDRVYAAKHVGPLRSELWMYDLRVGKLERASEYDGLIADKSAQGALAYEVGSTQPWLPGTAYTWGTLYGKDLLVIDSTGAQHWLDAPEVEMRDIEEICVQGAIFSPDGEKLLVVLSKNDGEVTLWKKLYVVDWVRGKWQEVKWPEADEYWFESFWYWRPNGVWWSLSSKVRAMTSTIAVVDGLEEVTAE